MKTGINVLSLFNGNGGTWLALDELKVPIDNMYVSEIDKYASQAADLLNPNNINLGDVTKWQEWDIDWSGIDLLVAGFPCQAWSLAGKQKGDDDPRGALVHDLLNIHRFLRAVNPHIKFMFENVAMKKEFLTFINKLFQTEPVLINSALVTAQNRKRNYWANWEITQPEDKGILLKDIIEGGTIDATIMTDKFSERQKGRKCLVDEPKDKAVNLSAMEYVKNGRQGDYVQCDKDGNQTVFRPCELREGKKPLSFMEWIEKHHQDEVCMTIDRVDYEELEGKYMMGKTHDYDDVEGHVYEYDNYLYDFLYGEKSPLCHHVATATDINANESNKCVYADTGKAPTVTTMGGGHREPKVLVQRPASIVGRRINEKGVREDYNKNVPITQCLQVKHNSDKTGCITTVQKDNVLSTEKPGRYIGAYDDNPPKYRKLTPRECFRLQTVPEHHIDTLLNAGISNTQLYKMCGNGWTMKVISHIFKAMLCTK